MGCKWCGNNEFTEVIMETIHKIECGHPVIEEIKKNQCKLCGALN